MAIPSWAVEALRRGVGGVMERVPPDTIEQWKRKANDLLAEIPQTAARGVDTVMRSAKAGRDQLQRWSRRHVSLITPVVNGSGCLHPGLIVGAPVCAEAIEVAAEALLSGALQTSTALDRLNKRLAKCLPSPDYDILVTANVEAACLAVGVAHQADTLCFHRSQSIRLPNGRPFPDAFAAGLGHRSIREVGSINGVDEADLNALDERAVAIAVENGHDQAIWFRPRTATSAAAQRRVVYAPVAAWTAGTATSELATVPHVFTLLQQDADLVITPGDGWIGGPQCGLLVGRRERIEFIRKSELWPVLAANVATQAALVLTLEALVEGEFDAIPVQAMLRTSAENLRHRAERLAMRIAAEPAVQSCRIADAPATFAPGLPWQLPSRQLLLAPASGTAAEWAQRLLQEVPAVSVGVVDNAISVDLRWIQPSDDASLVAALVGHELPPEAIPDTAE